MGTNGETENAAGKNEGSCKVFSMGKLLGWSEKEVLASFGEHYRQVLGDPDGSSHGNIRAFMKQGWAGVQFAGARRSRWFFTWEHSCVHEAGLGRGAISRWTGTQR